VFRKYVYSPGVCISTHLVFIGEAKKYSETCRTKCVGCQLQATLSTKCATPFNATDAWKMQSHDSLC
jgi:hypothetical protein